MKSLLPPELQVGWDIRDTVPRRDRLRELAFAGYRIPRCGLFKDMARLGVPLVVYTDEMAHCGEGKVLWHPGQEGRYDGLFGTEYVPDRMDDYEFEDGESVIVRHSRRELVVGHFRFGLLYESTGSWSSNVDGDFRVTDGPHRTDRHHDLLPYPMYAVDYTKHCDEDRGCDLYHFDLDTCPGVPVEVVNLVGRDVLTESVAKFCRERGLTR